MKQRLSALMPFIVFLIVFASLNIIYSTDSVVKDNFPIFAAVIALIFSFFTFTNNETVNEKVDIFIQGSSQPIVIHMCYIFFLSTVFTTILEQTGGIQSAVHICLQIIPVWFIIPSMFLVASLFSFTVGTSMGAIAAFMPIAVHISNNVGLNPSLMAATIVCGAMFGDNLSILSDTTIAAVKVTGTNMIDKLHFNIKIVIPAFIGSILVLTYQNLQYTHFVNFDHLQAITSIDIINILPYVLTFYLASIGVEILATLVCGIVLSLLTGLLLQKLTLLSAINLLFDGFYSSKGMVNIFILVLLLSGLSAIITHNGGIQYVITQLKYKISTIRHAKIAILLMVIFINITIAINTITILITGPIAKKLSDEYNINNAETACILDIGSCVTQGLLPYTPQLLLAASIAKVSTISLIPYLYYQILLGASLLITIIWRKK